MSEAVGRAHCAKKQSDMEGMLRVLIPALPNERDYMPHCSEGALVDLGMKKGVRSKSLSRIGKGVAHEAR